MLTVRILSCGRARTEVRNVKLAAAGWHTPATGPQVDNIAETILFCPVVGTGK